jgi:uncharacterized protein YodC (DUF2158 family)
VPIEQKESIRWLQNVRQSADLLDDPGRCVHIGDRESDVGPKMTVKRLEEDQAYCEWLVGTDAKKARFALTRLIHPLTKAVRGSRFISALFRKSPVVPEWL